MHLDPKGLAAASTAIDSFCAGRDVADDIASVAIRAYLSSAIPGEVAELAGDLHSFADRLAHVRNPTDMLTVRSAATALTSLAARIEALEAELGAHLAFYAMDLTFLRNHEEPERIADIEYRRDRARLLLKKDRQT